MKLGNMKSSQIRSVQIRLNVKKHKCQIKSCQLRLGPKNLI